MENTSYSLIVILVAALVTFGTRVAPFIFFGDNKPIPGYIIYLGKVLPPAIMAMLLVYCLRNTNIEVFPYGLSEVMAITIVAALHIWKRNNLLSILGGTAAYMVAVQYIFV